MIKPKRIIIWGLRKKYHTHQYIHRSFYENAKKLGYTTLWLEDDVKNAHLLEPNDLVISAEVQGKMVPEKKFFADYHLPVVDGVYYCLHNYKDVFTQNIKKDFLTKLCVYHTPDAETGTESWGLVTKWNSKTRLLYQPWGTNLLPHEFKKPTFNTHSFMFWVGSVWDNELGQGNKQAIAEFKTELKTHTIKFIHVRFIPDWLNVILIRISRIAPAIAGKFQVDINYLPCRMFKNISYGQLGISNVKKFDELLGDASIKGSSIKEITNKAFALSKDEYKALVEKQQNVIKEYTYKTALENIFKTFN